ncbi:hypothetical protein D6817_01575, partial [Candidatus Pacearchaeota archaeon]
LLPDFILPSGQKEPIAIIRYSIPDDKLEWYDGTEFHEFDSKAMTEKIGKYYVPEFRTKELFWEFYLLGRPASEPLVLSERFTQEFLEWYGERASKLAEIGSFKALIGSILTAKERNMRGAVKIDVVHGDYGESPKPVYLNKSHPSLLYIPNGNLYYLYNKGKKSNIVVVEPENLVIDLNNPTRGHRGEIYVLPDGYKEKVKRGFGFFGIGMQTDDLIVVGRIVGYLKSVETSRGRKYRIIIFPDKFDHLKPAGSAAQNDNFFTVNPEDYLLLQDFMEGTYFYDPGSGAITQGKIEGGKFVYEGNVGAYRYGFLYLNLDNSLEFDKADEQFAMPAGNPVKLSTSSAMYKEIAPKAIAWRDSVFAHPMALEVCEDVKCKKPVKKYFCVRKVRSFYLTVDLSKEVDKNAKCAQ